MIIAAKRRSGRLVARAAGPAVVAMVAGAFALASPAQAAQAAHRAGAVPRSLAGSHPTWATAHADRGATAAGTRVSAQVYLAGRNPAGLAAYAKAVSSPRNALYHHYLSAAQQKARFGPTVPQVRAIDAWVTHAGLRVTARSEQAISVTGSAAAVRKAFGTQLRNYELAGHVYYAPSHNAVVPADVAPAVLGVAGLDNAPRLAHPAATPTPTQGRVAGRTESGSPYIGPTPCSTYWGEKTPTDLPDAYGHSNPWPVCGYTPNQLRDAYGEAATGLTGKGVTVAIVDAYASSTMPSDANTFDVDNDFAPFSAGQYTQVVTPSQWNSEGECGGPADWQPEESLDIESVHTMAPAANVVYVGANSCNDNDFLAAFATIVDNHLASIVTNSWGGDLFDTTGNEPVASIDEYTQIFEQAAIEGIGFYFSSGDCSDEDPAIVGTAYNCDPDSSEPQTSFPASDPWVTAVGASAIGIGSHNHHLFETGMGDSEATLQGGTTWSSRPGTFVFGSGGGTSDYFTQPFYQPGVVPASLSHRLLTGVHSATPMREVPDVAMEGDLLAATMVGFTQELPDGSTGFAEAGYGGTSVSSPLFAGVQADAQQAARFPIGFANPEIYFRDRLLGPLVFRDITDHPRGRTYASAVDEGLSDGERQGALFTLGSDYTLHATRGYDDVTGVGSPTALYLESFRI